MAATGTCCRLALFAFAMSGLIMSTASALAQPNRPPQPAQQPIYELRFENNYDFPVLLKFVGFQNAANYTSPIGPGESVRQNIYAGQRVACVWDMQGNVIMHEVVTVDRHGVIRFGPPPATPAGPMGVAPGVGGPPPAGQPGVAAPVVDPAAAGQPAVEPPAAEPAPGGAEVPAEPAPPQTGTPGAAAPAPVPPATGEPAAGAGGGVQVEAEPRVDPAPAEPAEPSGEADSAAEGSAAGTTGGGLTIEPEAEAAPPAGGQQP